MITVEQFQEITKGVPGYIVARVLQHRFTRGTCWTGCSKAQMCEAVCKDKDGRGNFTYAARVDPDAFRKWLAEDVAWQKGRAEEKAKQAAEDAKRANAIRTRQTAVYKAAQAILSDTRSDDNARTCAEYARGHIPLYIRDAVDEGKA